MTRPVTRHVPDHVEGAITVRSAAKINLHLGVGARRADGYHALATVFHAVGLYDDLVVTPAEQWKLTLTAAGHVDTDQVPGGDDNIVACAAALLTKRAAGRVRGRSAHVHITKEIPVAGGMAGGSADAAAALVALDRLWGLHTSDDDLLALAGELGSDVPFALVGGTALGTGRGEVVDPVPDEGPWWWVVVPSEDGLSTPDVYAHFDRLRPDAAAEPAYPTELIAALAARDAVRLGAALHNDLQEAACDLRPELGDVIAAGEAAGAVRGILSGSGPTCVFLCTSGDHARDVAATLAADHPVVLVANGPVAGTHLLEYA